MKHGWLAPMALVLVSSAVPLVQVGLDRSAPPRQTLLLTHRELMVGWTGDENSGVTLTWSWATPPDLDSLSRERLTALGISCGHELYQCNSGRGHRGWMVVGVDPDRWRGAIDSLRVRIDSNHRSGLPDSIADRRIHELVSRMKELVLYTSRLTMDAVGQDPAALAAEWNDGKHLVLAAVFHASRQTWPRDTLPGEKPLYHIYAEPVASSLYLPAQWAAAVEDTIGTLQRGYGERQQMYEVTVAVGRWWLPRVLEVVRLPDPKWPIDSLEWRVPGTSGRGSK
ncbi:MAG: DUF4824 family protein [Gemmatimonadales bacterium]